MYLGFLVCCRTNRRIPNEQNRHKCFGPEFRFMPQAQIYSSFPALYLLEYISQVSRFRLELDFQSWSAKFSRPGRVDFFVFSIPMHRHIEDCAFSNTKSRGTSTDCLKRDVRLGKWGERLMGPIWSNPDIWRALTMVPIMKLETELELSVNEVVPFLSHIKDRFGPVMLRKPKPLHGHSALQSYDSDELLCINDCKHKSRDFRCYGIKGA